MLMKARAIGVFPYHTFVKGPQSSEVCRTVLACNGIRVGKAMDVWGPFHFHSTTSHGVYPLADCAISLSDSCMYMLVTVEQGHFLHYKNLPLLCLIQRCSGNLALFPPLLCPPKVLFFLQKHHVVSFSHLSRWIWMIVCAQGYCSYLLF